MPLPVISIAQMREWEKATWLSGQKPELVIQKVGREIAAIALRITKPKDRILVLCGKGNNGADARGAVPHLADREVEILTISDPASDLAALSKALNEHPSLILDGLFGIGLDRDLDPHWQRLLEIVNSSGTDVLAADTPSGLDADSGEPRGAAIRAAITVTVGAPKLGLLRSKAGRYVGRLECAADVGLIPCPCVSDIQWTTREDFQCFPPRREAESHKGTYGHLAIVAGSLGYHGAAVLCSKGAQRAQPGLITVHVHDPAYLPVASQSQAVMVSPWNKTISLPENCTGLLIGPGLAHSNLPAEIKDWTAERWRESPFSVIVDASALAWLPRHTQTIRALRVITPHPGEAAKMLGITAAEVQEDRPRAIRRLSQEYGNAVVVLKGNRTVVGRSIGELFVNSTGNPRLAQGGSGDVLAGYISGLLAQPALSEDFLLAIRYGVWQHGAAADFLQSRANPWTVEDLHTIIGTVR